MRNLTKGLVAPMLLLSVLSVGGANGAVGIQNIPLVGVVGLNSANLSAHVEDGVAFIFGQVDSGNEAALAMRYVESIEGVESVVDQITVK